MILVGQFDSPFVRRVAIALHHYGMPFERRVLSVFKDFDEMLAINPLGKVPSLILDDGEVLFESRAIIDFLDGIAPPEKRLAPAGEPERFRVLRTEAIGIGLAEKVYERGIEHNRRSPGTSDPKWRARLERQIVSAADWLEARQPVAWFHGTDFSRADLAVAVAMQYLARVLPDLDDPAARPHLREHRARCEALAAFRAVQDSRDEALASGWTPETGV
jgi:glutathione S-transferase